MAAIAHPHHERWQPARPRLVVVPAPRRPAAVVYWRRRLLAAVAVLVALVVLLLAARGAADLLGAGTAPAAPVPAAPAVAGPVHVVQPGETYWSIARSLAGDADVRPVVDALVAANAGRPLVAGDRLTLPG